MSPSLNVISNSKATFRVAFFFGPLFQVLAVALALLLSVQAVSARTWRVGVQAVLDGDTVILDGGERLRLRGIDAPEIARGDKPGQHYCGQSRDRLFSLVTDQLLDLEKNELGRDRHGRLVGIARLADGRMVNLIMIEEGAAFVYPHPSDKDRALADRLLAAQNVAMGQGKGFWPAILSGPAAEAEYVGTKGSKRFHTLPCTQGRKVGVSNRVYFSSLREAFAAGYAPARECTPWPVQSGR
jgi:micrococcal nuclease